MSSAGLGTRWRVLPAALYAIAVVYGGVIDIGELPKVGFMPTDKLLHTACFFGLEVLIEWGLPDLAERKRRLWAVALSIALGALIEIVQSALPYRSAEFLDLVADAVGAVLAAFSLFLATRVWRRANAA